MKNEATDPENRRPVIFTVANQITVLRLLLIPVIVIGLLENPRARWVMFLLFFSFFTDLLDGIAARLRRETTRIGAFLDPMADKLLLTAVYVTLAYRGIWPVWVFVIIFSRDLLIVLGWAVIYILTGSSKIQPRLLGKITTGVQMVTVAAFLMVPDSSPLRGLLLWSTVFVTAASAIDYVYIGEKRLGEWN